MDNVKLISRNVNCSNLSEDQFVQMLFSDLLEAEEVFNETYSIKFIKRCIENYNNNYSRLISRAKAFAEKNWKTEKRQKQYINEVINKEKDHETAISLNFDKLSFFDFNVFPGSMGISYDCVLSYKDLTFDKLHKCFNCIKESDYFKHAKGWQLVYHPGFRSQIELILDDEYQKKADDANDALARAVEKFYKGTHYWGD